jgi:hypothetical protein
MASGGDPGETVSVPSPAYFGWLLRVVGFVLVVSTVFLVVAFFVPAPLAEHQEMVLGIFEDGFKVSLAAFIALVAGKVVP